MSNKNFIPKIAVLEPNNPFEKYQNTGHKKRKYFSDSLKDEMTYAVSEERLI